MLSPRRLDTLRPFDNRPPQAIRMGEWKRTPCGQSCQNRRYAAKRLRIRGMNMRSFHEAGCVGRIIWIGRVTDRKSSIRSSPVRETRVTFSGLDGDSHFGLTRPSCVRVAELYEEGTEIRNTRQISILSSEELDEIAKDSGSGELPPNAVGANLVVRGIPHLSLLPPSSRLQSASGATLVVDSENLPCLLPAREIEATMPGRGKHFKSSAINRRGVTAWVEREGILRIGELVKLFIPAQPPWPGPGR